MFGKAFQFTLRRMQAMFTRPATLVTLVVASLAMGISGPFGTYEHFALGPRLAYWAVMSFATFAAGYAGGAFAAGLVAPRAGFFLTVPVTGIASGVLVTIVVIIVNAFSLWDGVMRPYWAAEMLIYCVAISTGIAAVFAAFRGPANVGPVHRGPPRLVMRLPVGQRGDLVSLSVNDHYVDVVTTKGKAMLLMRLGDAIAEVDGVPGIQIHRSHWVALAEVRRVHRAGGRVTIETKAGDRLPVSRGYLPAARQAGLVT